MSSPDNRSRPDLTLLYDGDCAFCSWTVRQLRPMDRHGRLRFVPLQLAEDPTRRPRLAELTRGMPLRETLHAVDARDRITTGGAALLEILTVAGEEDQLDAGEDAEGDEGEAGGDAGAPDARAERALRGRGSTWPLSHVS